MAAQNFDFVVLGAGLGGMAAAIRAHDLGLSTIVLEKSDQIGGVAAYSSGYQWCAGNHLAARAGIRDSWEEGYTYLRAFAGGTNDDRMLETLCRTAPEAYRYYGDQAGVRWCLFSDPDNRWPDLPGSRERGRCIELEPFDVAGLPDTWRGIVRQSVQTDLFTNEEVYWKMGGRAHKHEWDPTLAESRRALGIRYQGMALAAYFVTALHARRIPMFTEVEVAQLLTERRGITGIAARVNGTDVHVRAAKGVLIALGGYDWNPELVKRFDNRTELGSTAPRSVTGDHFRLLEHLRPKIYSGPRSTDVGFVEPASFGKDRKARHQHFWAGFPHSITVNQAGQRFGAEDNVPGAGSPRTTLRLFDNDGNPLNWPAYAIFDSQYRAKYPIGRIPPGEPLPECFVSAPTLADLAARLGIDPRGLEETAERFNAGAKDGLDPQFGRGENLWSAIHYCDVFAEPNRSVAPLTHAPYYGVPLTQTSSALGATGLVIDDHARVLNEDDDVIERLYATGNSTAYRDLGHHYHSGTANTRNMTWAYVAANHAAAA